MSSFPNGISSMKLKVSTFEQDISSASLGSNSIQINEEIKNAFNNQPAGTIFNPSIAVTYSNTGSEILTPTVIPSYVPIPPPPPPLSLLSNGVTIKYDGLSMDVADTTARFIQADPRGNGMEWFAVVKDGMKNLIKNYSISSGWAGSFTPSGESSPVPFNNIVTTLMTDMSGLFSDVNTFNQNIASWDTSNVTNMSSMFDDAFVFNQNIGYWDTSSVTNMSSMFYYAYAFNGAIGSWNTTSVTSMSCMFVGATAFNQNVSGWNVDNVEYYENFYTSSGLDNNSDLLYVPEKFRPSSINEILDEIEEIEELIE